ncbi:MAG: glycoside hydrolase family 36 protein [Mobilitalea sp.]
MSRIVIEENKIHVVLDITKEGQIKLLHFSALPFYEEDILVKGELAGFNLVEVEIAGLDRPLERHGNKYIASAPGYRMKYESHKDYRNEIGRKLEITTYDAETGIYVISHLQFFDDISVVRSHSEVINKGDREQTLTYISSFNYTGIEKEGILQRDDKISVRICHNSWQREMDWQTYSLPQLGIGQSQPTSNQKSSKVIGVTNTGNWSTKEYLPMGYMENTETGTNLFWQIEHNGSWHWEISDQTSHLYLALSGPTEIESHWFKNLKTGDRFVSVPVAVGVNANNFDSAIGELTKYRRSIRRPNKDNETLAVIFNDYMNCLWGDPTAEKEFPLIDAASQAGCEYFCIDAGWYSKGPWWDNVGEWQESKDRFPNGLKEVTDYIRNKGMVPGVWLEIEVMGIKCPKAEQVPEDWFFVRHGKKVYDRSRYQLDFRNPEVRAHADEVIDRLVKEYGVGYIKMDYNIEPGIGTETKADSIGEGLLGHERAYLAWLDGVFARYPDLIIENCSSGGLRIDYAMLSRYSIQSTSDQEDYRRYATIAANSPSGLTPEQSAIWSYPLREGDKEEVVFNMVNAMLLRIHQSGHLAELNDERKILVKEALDYYKSMRQDIRTALPIWPIGVSEFSDTWVSLGLCAKNKIYLAVWRRNSETDTCILPLPQISGKKATIKCVYPKYEECESVLHISRDNKSGEESRAVVKLPKQYMARVFEVTWTN